MKFLTQNKIKIMKKMKAYLVPFMALVVVALAFTSCDKDQAGVYNPDKKISKVYVQEIGEPKYMTEQWTWEGKTLSKISYYDANEFDGSDIFTYEDGRLTKITDNYGYYANYTYDAKHYAKIEYFNPQGTLLSELTFTYTDEKVTSMVLNTFTITKQYVTMFQRGFLGRMLPKAAMQEVVKKSILQDATQSKETTNIAIVYDGDNISAVTVGTYSMTITGYDTKVNPLFNSTPFSTYNESTDQSVFSKNNPGTITTSVDGMVIPTTYIYTYDGNYPTIIEGTTSFLGQNVSSTTTIEYL